MDDFMLVALIACFVFGLIGAYIAGEKNRSGLEGFLFGFFLSIIGLIIIGILPTIEKKKEQRERTQEEIVKAKLLYEKSKKQQDNFVLIIFGLIILGFIISYFVGMNK
jgi:di/tricarboxylate transporter